MAVSAPVLVGSAAGGGNTADITLTENIPCSTPASGVMLMVVGYVTYPSAYPGDIGSPPYFVGGYMWDDADHDETDGLYSSGCYMIFNGDEDHVIGSDGTFEFNPRSNLWGSLGAGAETPGFEIGNGAVLGGTQIAACGAVCLICTPLKAGDQIHIVWPSSATEPVTTWGFEVYKFTGIKAQGPFTFRGQEAKFMIDGHASGVRPSATTDCNGTEITGTFTGDAGTEVVIAVAECDGRAVASTGFTGFSDIAFDPGLPAWGFSTLANFTGTYFDSVSGGTPTWRMNWGYLMGSSANLETQWVCLGHYDIPQLPPLPPIPSYYTCIGRRMQAFGLLGGTGPPPCVIGNAHLQSITSAGYVAL